ncbi:MAG: molybdopterin-binding protein [Alphaproteobacteria bacterium]|nr:molybdopterin-binding protein [Alphaproteobacteria bacterium]
MNASLSEITAGIVVIGNEILSGRTQDTNVVYIAQHLTGLGIDLQEVRIVPDTESAIIKAVNELRPLYTYIFTTGGIGSTHDDITVVSIAKAFECPLVENPEAMKILQDNYGETQYDSVRRRMALMPDGVRLINNPVYKCPSFQIENVFVLAGLPLIMHDMFQSILPRLKRGRPIFSCSVTSSLLEHVITDALSEIQDAHPQLSIGSYPFHEANRHGTSFVVRGTNRDDLTKAIDDLAAMVRSFGAEPIVDC